MDKIPEPYWNRIMRQADSCLEGQGIAMFMKGKAVCRKYQSTSWNGRCKLTIKLLGRLLGIHRPLFISGYREDIAIKQQIEDLEVYCECLEKKMIQSKDHASLKKVDSFNNDREQVGRGSYNDDHNMRLDIIVRLLAVKLKEQDSFLILMAENLDKGGLEEVVRTLAVEYHARGLPVKVLCAHEGGHIARQLISEGIEVIIFHGKKAMFDQYIKENRPIIVNTHFVESYIDVLRKYNVPVIETIHNMYVFLSHGRCRKENEKATKVKGYIAVSEIAKDFYIRKIISGDNPKITVIGNAISEKYRITMERNDVRDLLGISEETMVFISVGSVDARKNQIGMLRALDIVRKITSVDNMLLLVGNSTDIEYEHKLQKMLQDREFGDSVKWIGFRNDVINILNAADVFILDSYYEGWSMAATEALCCGLPLIHSRCGSGVELTAEGHNGILIDNPLKDMEFLDNVEIYDRMHAGINENIRQLVDAMLDMIANRQMWQARKYDIKEYCRRNFSISKMIEQYLDVYLEACEKDEI